ncbi:MAG: DUF4097 domain-containing protein [Candidatus Eisenbacteria bacterium]|nr:DUF4097 family beta strand repeat-containing protein [Candidatus Eisenbacteria bacterium]
MSRKSMLAAMIGLAALGGILMVLPKGVRAGSPFDRRFQVEAQSLVVGNVVGEVRVVGSTASAFEVEVAVRGKDASADRVRFEQSEGADAKLSILFPSETRFVYPPLGRGSKTSFRLGNEKEGWLDLLLSAGRGKEITVSGSGSGTEIWADVTVHVPAGRKIEIRHGVGSVTASGTTGGTVLATHGGPITAENVEGGLTIDTGSGKVVVHDVRGGASIDTGSGDVELRGASGGEIVIDTGSGSVEVDAIDCSQIQIDTGSGTVEAMEVRADRGRIDTGSGSIRADFGRMGPGPFDLETGSGAVDLRIPADASASISASTGSGRIRCDLTEAQLLHKDQGEMSIRVGAGAATVRIDTGSGSIDIHDLAGR